MKQAKLYLWYPLFRAQWVKSVMNLWLKKQVIGKSEFGKNLTLT